MKIRLGFVSNSSSSSYVCNICGEEACGRDISLHEFEMFECGNGHYGCYEHLIHESSMGEEIFREIFDGNKDPLLAYVDSIDKDEITYFLENEGLDSFEDCDDYRKEDGYIYVKLINYLLGEGKSMRQYTSKLCPVCKMDEFVGIELAKYLMKRENETKKTLIKEIKSKFKDYKSFKEYFKEVNLNAN